MGIGFAITAKNLAKAAFEDAQKDLGATAAKGDEAGEAFEKMGENLKTAGVVIAAAGGAILATLVVGADKAHELAEAMKLVSTRADEATLPLEGVNKSVLELSNRFGVKQTALARAYYDAIGLGATDAASSSALVTAATHLSVGSQTDLAAALQTTAQAARAFGVPLTDSAKIADQLFAASSRGAGSVSELGETLIHLGPAAAAAGLGSEELLGSMTALAEHGVRGRAAMAGMKAVLEAISEPTKEAKIEAAALGITLDKGKIAAMGFGPWLERLAGNSHLTADAMKKLGLGGEAAVVTMSLLKNGAADVNEQFDQISKSAGAASGAAATMTDEFTRFGALKDNALTALGKGLLEVSEPLIKIANGALEWFTNLSEGTQGAIAGVTAFIGVALVLTGVALAAAGAMVAFDTAAGAAMLAAFAVALPIVGMVVGALAGLALVWYGVKKAWEADLGGIKTTVESLWAKVSLAWNGITQLFSQGGFSGAVRAELDKAGNSGIRNFAITVFLWGNRVIAFFSGMGDTIGDALSTLAVPFKTIGDMIGEIGNAIGSLVSGPNDPKKAASAFHTFAEAGKAVGAVLGLVVRAVSFLITVALVPLQLVIGLLTGGWDGFKDAGMEAFRSLLKGLFSLAEGAAAIADHIAAAFGADLGAQAKLAESIKNSGILDDGKAPAPTASPIVRSGSVPNFVERGAVSPAYSEAEARAQRAGALGRLHAGESSQDAARDGALVSQMTQLLAVMKEQAHRPIHVHVDGEKIAEASAAGGRRTADRGFGALPSPG